jgi:hypothetical protein
MDPTPVEKLPGFIPAPPQRPIRYCPRCQAELPDCTGIGQCVACGQRFDSENAASYLDRREFSLWLFWFPGYCLAVAIGTIVYSFALWMAAGQPVWGGEAMAVFIVLPVSASAILGYGTGLRGCLRGLLAIVGLAAIAGAVALRHPLGAVGAVAILLSPDMLVLLFASAVLGASLRRVLKGTLWSQRWFFPASVPMARARHNPPAVAQTNRPRRRPRPQFRLIEMLAFISGLAVVMAVVGSLGTPILQLGIGVAVIAAAQGCGPSYLTSSATTDPVKAPNGLNWRAERLLKTFGWRAVCRRL